MLLSRNSGCKGTKFISNAEIFFYLFSFNRVSLACFYVNAALFLQEKGYIAHHTKQGYISFLLYFVSISSFMSMNCRLLS